jgi:hypothetical protein
MRTWLFRLGLLMLIASLSSPAPRFTPLPAAAQDNPGLVRAALLYSRDAATAQAYRDLMNAHGFSTQLIPIAALPARTLLPMVSLRAAQRSQAAPPPLQPVASQTAALPDFSQFDLIVAAADTGHDASWSPEPGLVQAIQASGLPVVGLGQGGYALFGALGLDIGYPHGTSSASSSIQVADFGDSQPVYSGPQAIPIPSDQVIQVFTAPQACVAIPLSGRLPEGVRLASLVTPAGRFPLVQTGARFLLWGFEAKPSQMTADGQKLFINSLNFQVSGLHILLRGRSFTPGTGIDPALLAALAATSLPDLHALAQFTAQPDEAQRNSLEAAGVKLLNVLQSDTFVVTVSKGFNQADPTLLSLLRWMGLFLPSDKVDAKVLAGQFEDWADNGDGSVNLLASFFSDVPAAEAEAVLDLFVTTRTEYAPLVYAVVMGKANIAALSQQDRLHWLEEGPVPLKPVNDIARTDLHVDEVQNADTTLSTPYYLGMSGSGVRVGVFDTGTAPHPDFGTRLLRAQADGNGHGTHVSGIIGADGSSSVLNCPTDYGTCTPFQLRGMAPQVRIAPYGGWNAATMNEAVNTHGIEISNHSYAPTCGPYTSDSQTVDNLVRGDLHDGATAIPAHLVVGTSANQGDGAQYCRQVAANPATGPRGYYSVLNPAKNALILGAVDRNSNYALSGFSSRGPTWDGRLKPEVVANGCMYSTDHASSGYVPMCGTSMAAPATVGVLALVTQQFHSTFPTAGRPAPSTLRALLIQTATDLAHFPGQPGFAEYGWNDPDTGQPVIFHPGPDWSTGYGVIHAQRAVAAVRARNILEGTVSPADLFDEYTLNLPAGRHELKVTLTWDDEAGDPTKAITATQLVNDLDLTLRAPGGATYQPWVLPALPRGADLPSGAADPITRATDVLPAVRGVDRLNNVEQVGVTSTTGLAAGAWVIRVEAHALPNAHSQKYSLAGDFRTLNIVEPQTGNFAEAGDPASPNIILVVLEAANGINGGPSSMQDAAAGDFTVAIDGTAADILSGTPVGDQFWLNVRPASGVYTAGHKYDLDVTWTGYGEDHESHAVLFTEGEITDRAIVLDHSGSMADYDKIGAAHSAARLFIDQSLIGDRIAVVGFSTSASTPYALTTVTNAAGNPELSAAKAAVDSLLPTDWTAIGQGLLAGQSQVTAAPADYSVKDVIVLLSDGMENVDPYYDTPAVKGVIEPTDTIIDTVAVGPSSAGLHALLQTIADQNGGVALAVTDPSAGGLAPAGLQAATGAGLDAFPTTLYNRLGDAYKTIAEDILHENRLLQVLSFPSFEGTPQAWDVEVPDGMRRLTFSLNWAMPGEYLHLEIQDPDGNLYRFDEKNPNCRQDTTHQVCIIEDKVIPGTWTATVSLKSDPANEFMLWVSGKTPVSFQLFVGTPQSQRTVHKPVLILGYVRQGVNPPKVKSVTARIFGPGFGQGLRSPQAAGVWDLTLYDDGAHEDGKEGDGIFGAYFLDGVIPGPYAVRGEALGEDLDGRPFDLFQNTSFHLMPRLLFVYKDGLSSAQAFQDLLQANSIFVELSTVANLPFVELGNYNLVIVGSDTGSLSEWGTKEAVDVLSGSERPVLGLGEGGYAYFGQLDEPLGYPEGAHSNGTEIQWAQASHPIWEYPYTINLREQKLLQLYTDDSNRVDIYLDSPYLNVFGYNDFDPAYANLVADYGDHMLWGFDDDPKHMTETGRQIFVNTAFWTMRY